MKSSDQRMIDTQAELISKLRAENADLDQQVRHLEHYKKAGTFYLEMQQAIIGNPTLQSMWDRFLVFLKLTGSYSEVTDDRQGTLPFIAARAESGRNTASR